MGLAPDFAEPLEAWRVWRVVERSGELALVSVVRGTFWPAEEPLVAECLRRRPLVAWARGRPHHAAPQPGCECGVYGAPLDHAVRYLSGTLPNALVRVLGRVALWGTVVECEHGYRASHAYPTALYVPAAGGDPACRPEQVALRLGRYGAPVERLPPDPRAAARLLRDRPTAADRLAPRPAERTWACAAWSESSPPRGPSSSPSRCSSSAPGTR